MTTLKAENARLRREFGRVTSALSLLVWAHGWQVHPSVHDTALGQAQKVLARLKKPPKPSRRKTLSPPAPKRGAKAKTTKRAKGTK